MDHSQMSREQLIQRIAELEAPWLEAVYRLIAEAVAEGVRGALREGLREPHPEPVGFQLPQQNRMQMAVSLAEAARMLGVCKKTVERLRDMGELRCLRLGRHWKVRVAELENYLKRQEAKRR